MKLSRLTIKHTQPDAESRKKLRNVYASDAAMLIAIGQTVPIEFGILTSNIHNLYICIYYNIILPNK